jgi:hypothetical protein
MNEASGQDARSLRLPFAERRILLVVLHGLSDQLRHLPAEPGAPIDACPPRAQLAAHPPVDPLQRRAGVLEPTVLRAELVAIIVAAAIAVAVVLIGLAIVAAVRVLMLVIA